MKKSDSRAVNRAERTASGALETWEADHDNTCSKDTLCRALEIILLSVPEDEAKIRKLFVAGIVRIVTYGWLESQYAGSRASNLEPDRKVYSEWSAVNSALFSEEICR